MSVVSAPPQADTWRRGPSAAVVATGSLALLLGLDLAFNWAFARAMPADAQFSPWFGMLTMLPVPVTAGGILVAMTLALGQLGNTRVSWAEVLAAYCLTGLSHVLSGCWAVCTLVSSGLPGPGQSLALTLNLGGWSGGIGRLLDRLTIDELVHMAAYGLAVAWLYRMPAGRRWVPPAVLLAGWLATRIVLGQLLPSMSL